MMYFIQYGDYALWFVAEADDAAHAVKKCNAFTDGEPVHAVFRGEQDDSWTLSEGASEPEPEEDWDSPENLLDFADWMNLHRPDAFADLWAEFEASR